MPFQFLMSLAAISYALAIQVPGNSALHFELHRRGSRFSSHEPVNATRLSQIVAEIEHRYSWTYRDVEGNRLVRLWKPDVWLDDVGLNHTWYFNLAVGRPSQILQVDINMLSPDFYTIMTSSMSGSKYDTFKADSHEPGQRYIHPDCRLAKDVLNLTVFDQLQFDWPVCQAPRYSSYTLRNSGSILGLAPHDRQKQSSLSRFTSEPFLRQLHRRDAIPSQIWSFTLLDNESGILTVGGTLAAEIEEARARAELGLRYVDTEDGPQQAEEQLKAHLALLGPSIEEQFVWVDILGSSGWWTGLISGIWINGMKILKNQPFLMDVNCPFILAPPAAFDQFYHSISGAKPLDAFEDQFSAFPCLNPPHVAFELAGWQFPVMGHGTREDAIHGPTGGHFSLGKVSDMMSRSSERNESHINGGFCVGAVVQTVMGYRKEWQNSGMKEVWVLGEPFFRGLGVVFDGERGKLGIRSY